MNTTELSTAYDIRLLCRKNKMDRFPSLAINGHLCLNLVMMDKDYATDFETFCRLNPKPCPLLGVIPAGQRSCPEFGVDIDLCTDLRSYDVYREGKICESRTEVTNLYTERTVSFLIGSSVSFDGVLNEKGLSPSYGPCIYKTDIDCHPVDRYQGKVAVTMRSYPPEIAEEVSAFTSHFPQCHGGPMADNPEALGIKDEMDQLLAFPGWVPDGHEKRYWACGITPSLVALEAKLPLMIVHTPGNAMVSDIKTMDLYV